MALTPHLEAQKDGYAKTVLMPGDPLRAKYIAETYLTDCAMVNGIRGALGYTGYYRGKRISVQASGMGRPSIAIYAYELYNIFDVDNIIRIGTAGAIHGKVNVRDIVIAMGACADVDLTGQMGLRGTFAPIASFGLLQSAVATAKRLNIPCSVGNMLTSDMFYEDNHSEKWAEVGVLAEEMEAAALYVGAAQAGKNALCICTISDNAATGEHCTPEERQTSFTSMMRIALEMDC